MIDITVAFPIGRTPEYRQYLPKCLESIKAQTKKPYELLIVDDAAHLEFSELGDLECRTRIYRFPWYFGVCAGLNACVSLSRTEWVFLMSCDDELLRVDFLERAEATVERTQNRLAWYYPCIYYDKPEAEPKVRPWPVMAGLVNKELWLKTGGLHVMTEFIAPDHAFKELLERRIEGFEYIAIDDPEQPSYYSRYHKASYTETIGKYGPVLEQYETARKIVELWEPPKWTEGFR